jgi:hypothetical protein
MLRGARQRLRNWWSGEDDGFDPVAVFRRLYTCERVILLTSCVIVVAAIAGGMLSSNLGPHIKALFSADGFNTGALTRLLRLIGSVTLITCMSYFIYARWLPFLSKALMVAVAMLLLHGSLKNSAGIQARDREARNSPYSTEAARIDWLDKRIAGLQATWKSLTKHEGDPLPDIVVASAELEALKQSADAECHFGKFGRTRGPKCERAEADRRAKSTEVQSLIGAHMSEVQAELPGLQRERATYPEKPREVDAEQEQITAFYSSFGFPGTAEFTKKHDAMIEALTMDLMVMTFLWPSLMALFRIFGAVSANRGEAERRVFECIPEFAEAVASVAAQVVPKSAPEPAHEPAAEVEEKRVGGWGSVVSEPPAQSEEKVLDIVGRDAPVFAEAPVTPMEKIAAKALEKDPERPAGKKARRKTKSKDSVKLWHKERIIARYGRSAMQGDLYADYERWCEDMNLIPEKAGAFGKVLREELEVRSEFTPGRRYKYHDIGLKPYLVAVA